MAGSIAFSKRVISPYERQRMESVFWKGFRSEDEFVPELVAIWNTFGGNCGFQPFLLTQIESRVPRAC